MWQHRRDHRLPLLAGESICPVIGDINDSPTESEIKRRGNNPFGPRGTLRCLYCQHRKKKVHRTLTAPVEASNIWGSVLLTVSKMPVCDVIYEDLNVDLNSPHNNGLDQLPRFPRTMLVPCPSQLIRWRRP